MISRLQDKACCMWQALIQWDHSFLVTDITCFSQFLSLLPSGCCLPPTVDQHLNAFLLFMPGQTELSLMNLGWWSANQRGWSKVTWAMETLKPPHLWAASHDFHIPHLHYTSCEVTAEPIAFNSVLCFNTIVLQPPAIYFQPLAVISKFTAVVNC